MSGIIFLLLRALLALALYAFLGIAVITIWRDLQKTSALLTTRQTPVIQLLRLDFEGESYKEFNIPIITIGRETNCEYTLLDETVSSHHARLSFHHKQWWVEDLNSTNGSFLNNDPITVPTVVISGDELRVGKISIQLIIKNE
ncbi:MAG: FHA domain-containing protein [Anaerolineae bacterium]|nr:FHA domain-containing protein [Anaerolineae bacterium]